MKEERYFYVPNADETAELPQEEAVHATRVLRLQEGDHIYLMNGKGTFYRAEVTLTTGKRCAYTIIETLPQEHSWRGHINIAMAPTKMMDRIEWMAEKATEIGVDEFSFLNCQFSERKQMRADRIEKIVISAVKQSRKPWKPIVNNLKDFRAFITEDHQGLKCICHCYNEIPRTDLFELLQNHISLPTNSSDVSNGAGIKGRDDVTILIGPEGDFSIEEVHYAIEHGYHSVSLGTQRLRTETAALSAVMQAQLTLRK